MNNLSIELLKEEDDLLYQDYLVHDPEASYEHSLEVRDLITRHFKFKPFYLVAKNDGKICAVLPLFKAKSLLEGTRFVSLPFFPHGGVLGSSPQYKRVLLVRAQQLAADTKFLEIRQAQVLPTEIATDFVKQSPIIDFFLELKGSEKEMFDSLHKDVRYDIRKAQKNNLTVQLGKEKKFLDAFYRVYLRTRKRRGLPAWPYSLFSEALQRCNALVAVTYLKDKPIAGAFLFLDRETIEYAFAGADYRYTSLCPYYLLLWEVICYALPLGYSILDFGGTTTKMNDGKMYSFKEKWSSGKKEIPYYFYASHSENIPQLESSFKLYSWYGKVWSLLPTPVIRLISPIVIRQFI